MGVAGVVGRTAPAARTARSASRAAPGRSRSPTAGTTPVERTTGPAPAVRGVRRGPGPTAAWPISRATCVGADIVSMYRVDTSGSDDDGREGRMAKRPASSSSPSSACCTRARCTATSCASGCNAVLGSFRAFSYGSLYPCLKALLADGLDHRGRSPSCRAAGREAVADRLQAHGRGQGALPGAARRERPVRLGGREFRRPLRVLRPDRRGHPAAHPRRPPVAARGAARRLPGRAHPDPGAARQLHPRAAAARPRVRRARGPLAHRADRRRASAPRVHQHDPGNVPGPRTVPGRRPDTGTTPRSPRRSTAWVRYA